MAKTFTVPIGSSPNATLLPARPLTTSLTGPVAASRNDFYYSVPDSSAWRALRPHRVCDVV